MASEQELRTVRLEKIQRLKTEEKINPYPAKYDRTHLLAEVPALKDGTLVRVAGRLITYRNMGKLAFGKLFDESGKLQAVFLRDELGEQMQIMKKVDLGDFVGVEGVRYTTERGENSVLAKKVTFLGKALLPLPEKFHGLADEETKQRQRYLDLISDEATFQRFKFRSDFIRTLREFYWAEGFREVETPTLLHSATGAAARPYATHNNGLDMDVYLRISHELPLKELIVGGFDKVFEIGKAFRNEGVDPSHLPEHTHLEHYCAYWDFEKNIEFTEKMFAYFFEKLKLEKKIKVADKEGKEQEVDFSTPWKRENFVELMRKETGLDILEWTDADELRKELKKKKIVFEKMEEMSLASLVDNLYKKVLRPKLIGPVILYGYPKYLQPLARTNDADNRLVDQFQLVVNGWELVKAYSELVDPVDQAERFAEQAGAMAEGDEEAMAGDSDFITALEHGAPPISGWGMGIDRTLAILTGQTNLREVVLFPLMRPDQKEEK